MPTYSYSCERCGVQFDRYQRFSDKPITRCPECRTGRVKRVLQPPAIVFKGSGWYATDHRSPSGQSSKKSEAEGGSVAKSDSKPEKKETKASTADE